MNEKELLIQFENEIFPLMEVVKEDSAHINAFLSRSIQMDEDFLAGGMKTQYADDKASYDSIRFLRKMNVKNEEIATTLTNYYMQRSGLSDDQRKSLDEKVWMITSLTAEMKIEAFKSLQAVFNNVAERAVWLEELDKWSEEYKVSDSKSTELSYINRDIKKLMDGKSTKVYPEVFTNWIAKVDLKVVKKLLELDFEIRQEHSFIRERINRLAERNEDILYSVC